MGATARLLLHLVCTSVRRGRASTLCNRELDILPESKCVMISVFIVFKLLSDTSRLLWCSKTCNFIIHRF